MYKKIFKNTLNIMQLYFVMVFYIICMNFNLYICAKISYRHNWFVNHLIKGLR